MIKEFSFFSFVMLLWFLLHSHILGPLDGDYADRWFYLASWASLSVCLISLFQSAWVQRGVLGRMSQLVLFLAVASGFAARSALRASDWSDHLRFYQREAFLHPDNAVMNNSVGTVLFQNGFAEEARLYFVKATELNPQWSVARNNLGVAFEKSGETSALGTSQ